MLRMATKTKKHKPVFLIQCGNVKVPVYERKQTKRGNVHLSYSVPDHSSGVRIFRNFADLNAARATPFPRLALGEGGSPAANSPDDGSRKG